jgi:hypothetical protein
MATAIPNGSGWTELVPGVPFVGQNGTRYPANWLENAKAAELKAIGGKTIIEPPAAPAGKQIAITGLGDKAGVPTRLYNVVNAPAPADPRPALRDAVMVKRDAVIDGGITFNGTVFQTRATDRENIAGAFSLALATTVAGGGAAGDLRWASADTDFGWIAADNSIVPMDAPTVLAFGRAAAAFKQVCTFHARNLKDQIDAAANPATVDIEAGWPA